MNGPYYDKYPELAQPKLKYDVRTFAAPSDESSVWNSLSDFIKYINEDGSYAYAGQIVAITNHDTSEEETQKDPTIAVVRDDKEVQIFTANHIFESYDLAKAWLTLNAGNTANPGTVVSIKRTETIDGTDTVIWGLYCVDPDMADFIRVSFDQTDIKEVTWADIVNNPFTEDAEDDNRLQYTDSTGEIHSIAYTSDLDKTPVLDTPPEDASTGLLYYQRIGSN